MTRLEFLGTVAVMLVIGSAGWALGWMWVPYALASLVLMVFGLVVAAYIFRAWVNWFLGPNDDVIWGRRD